LRDTPLIKPKAHAIYTLSENGHCRARRCGLTQRVDSRKGENAFDGQDGAHPGLCFAGQGIAVIHDSKQATLLPILNAKLNEAWS